MDIAAWWSQFFRDIALPSAHLEVALPISHGDAESFSARFRHFDHVLKRTEYLDRRQERASVNWRSFGESLGEAFLTEVRDSGIAPNLLQEPPRVLGRGGLTFEPQRQSPIASVGDLFVRGVCQVRNKYFHGEKLLGDPAVDQRDLSLIREADAVLNLAASRHPAYSQALQF
jgi:hypothetical protein